MTSSGEDVREAAGQVSAADLRVALLRLARRVRAEKSDAELGDSQFSVLATLGHHGPLSLRALAEHERVQPPSMTRTVAELTARGLVERTPHPDDGRQAIVRLTAAGDRAVNETRHRRDAWLTGRLEQLGPAQRRLLADATEILRRIAEE